MLFDAPQAGKRTMGPSGRALAGSVALHGALIGWMFFGPSINTRPAPPPQNIYQQLIEPNEKKLVWHGAVDQRRATVAVFASISTTSLVSVRFA